MGLKLPRWHSIPRLKIMDMPNPSQDHPCILWQKKPVIIQTDTSLYWLGTALLQDGHETCNANIERELSFGLKKFHTYIYSRQIIVQNNHKPLDMIQHKSTHVVLLWLLCMPIKYGYIIQYKHGKEKDLADGLSRFPSCTENLHITLHQHIEYIQFSKQETKHNKSSTRIRPNE